MVSPDLEAMMQTTRRGATGLKDIAIGELYVRVSRFEIPLGKGGAHNLLKLVI
jgi:hypothetical protein